MVAHSRIMYEIGMRRTNLREYAILAREVLGNMLSASIIEYCLVS